MPSSARKFCYPLTALFCLGAVTASAGSDLEKLQTFTSKITSAYEERRAQALLKAKERELPIRKKLGDGRLIELQYFDNDRPIYHINDNLNAAATVSADKLWPTGILGLSLNGAGETLGIWDGGSVRASHQEFGGRVTDVDATGLSDHATHVAGTMIASGTDANARGMSFAANLRSRDWNNDTGEMAADQLLVPPVSVSNHSYGFITGWVYDFFGDLRWAWFGDVAQSTIEDGGFGLYSQTAADWDQLVVDSPNYLIVTSAGNDRNENAPGSILHWHYNSAVASFELSSDFHPADGNTTGYDTIGAGGGSAKNILTVAAVSDIPGGYNNTSDVIMSSFSGWGPTDDGRVKPDLSANGIALWSSLAASDAAYAFYSGTSMASPNIAGTLGQLTQHARALYGAPLRASTMKALAINTADEAGTSAGPDYEFGWGLLNAAVAAQMMTDDASGAGNCLIREIMLYDSTVEVIEVYSDGAQPLRATIAWTDPAANAAPAVVDPANLMLVNDIDIRITGPNNVIHKPWLLDPSNPASPASTGDNFRDNIEQIHIETPVAGIYTIEISHKNSLLGNSAQSVSLVSVGIAEGLAPDVVLSPGVQDTGMYGHGYGTNQNLTEVLATFEYTGTDMVLSVTGYDIDLADEVSVYLNGVKLGSLTQGPNNDLNIGNAFTIPASAQLTGSNQIRFMLKTAGWIWGITDLLLTEGVVADVTLSPGVTDTGMYGHGYGTNQDLTKVLAAFEYTGTDMVLSVTGYDVDLADEISVYLNGVKLGYLAQGPNNDLNGGDSFAIPASAQLPGTNHIHFVPKNAAWIWGVTDLLLTDGVVADVTLSPGVTDTGLYGHGYGTNQNLAEVLATFAYTGTDMVLSVTGYDIDLADEISVYLNDVKLGYLSQGPNNDLNGGDSFPIPASGQFPGTNHIHFVPKNTAWIWGVTNLLLSE